MDKSWIFEDDRSGSKYLLGVVDFINFAFSKVSTEGTITCPCQGCVNAIRVNRQIAVEHLLWKGFSKGYTHWVLHGEEFEENLEDVSSVQEARDNIDGLLHETYAMEYDAENLQHNPINESNSEACTFFELLRDSQQELYPGCKKFSKLSFLVHLFHIKCLGGWTNKSFTMLLDLLKEAFPEGETLPNSFYQAKKLIGKLGLGYEKIDICPNKCMIYWKESAGLISCKHCGVSSWKKNNIIY